MEIKKDYIYILIMKIDINLWKMKLIIIKKTIIINYCVNKMDCAMNQKEEILFKMN